MKIIKTKRMTWIFIVSAATAILALVSGYLQYREKLDTSEKDLKKEKQLSDTYRKLQERSDEIIKLQKDNKQQTDTIIDLQKINQESTNSIVDIQKELQSKTQDVADLNRDIAIAQAKLIADNERDKNPLFPIRANIRFKFPLEGNVVPKKIIDTLYDLKEKIEKGVSYDRRDFLVTWHVGHKEISQINFKESSRNLNSILPISFLGMLDLEAKLKQNQTNSLKEDSPSIFAIYFTLRQNDISESNKYTIDVDFDKKELHLLCYYANFYSNEQADFASFGVLDLYNRYLLFQMPKLCQYEIQYLLFHGENSRSGYRLRVDMSKTAVKIEDDCIFYTYKIHPKDVIPSFVKQRK
ncbi:MAG: hypothetical protein JNK27_15230 [Chitinophagaceae bacterium]|nr:hypothetical protein [Chitinophagaceae bacterium]